MEKQEAIWNKVRLEEEHSNSSLGNKQVSERVSNVLEFPHKPILIGFFLFLEQLYLLKSAFCFSI